MRSAMVPIISPWARANSCSCGRRAMLPSSFMTSHNTPMGVTPASRHRSTAASVWPARTSTPPRRERSGKMCPGRAKSAALEVGLASPRMVAARSAEDTPVVVPARRSTDTVKAVRCDSLLTGTICGSSSRASPASSIGTQMMPLVCRIMKATASAVACSAAMMRSPSFSRSSSSTTITMRPARSSASISPTELSGAVAGPVFALPERGRIFDMRGAASARAGQYTRPPAGPGPERCHQHAAERRHPVGSGGREQWRDHLIESFPGPCGLLFLPAVLGQPPLPIDREADRQTPDASVAGGARVAHQPHRETQRLRHLTHLGESLACVEAEAEYPESGIGVLREIVGEQRQFLAAWRTPGRPEGEDHNLPEHV